MPHLTAIHAREILDSRGNPTVETVVALDDGSTGIFAVPSGASTGAKEALELRDSDPTRFGGKGVLTAVANVNEKIAPALIGKEVTGQRELDDTMIALDSTPNKSSLGANAILSVSVAAALAGAASRKQEPYVYIHDLFGGTMNMPLLFFNVINGGKHAAGRLAFQEYMLCPQTESAAESVQAAATLLHALKAHLVKIYGPFSANIGDEGGFVPDIADCQEPFAILAEVVKNSGITLPMKFSVDAAANSFFSDNAYAVNSTPMAAEQLLAYYRDIAEKFPLLFIEDPFNENDTGHFAQLFAAVRDNAFVVGDDLTVTNTAYIKNAIDADAAGGFIIKLNQIGTLSETLDAIRMVQQNGRHPIISHRSGETNSDFIADLAVGTGAYGIKAGAPQRGERVAKYNRFLALEQLLKK